MCFVGATFILFQHQTLPLPGNWRAANASSLWLHAVAGIWWLLGARVLVAVMSFTLNHNRRWREARLFPDLTAAAIYTAAVLVVLISVLALPIGGLLATSGVLAIVLGLALQNTLADVFAGIAFGIEAPFNVGDRISLGDKIEGTVVQMNWRSIRILTDGDDVAIVPNSVVAKSDIVNRSFPTRVRSAFIELSCPATSNPERVIDTLQQATLLCPTILPTPPSSAVLTRLGSKESRYRVNFSVSDTEHLSTTKDLLLRHARRQLYYSGLYFQRAAQDTRSPDEGTGRPFRAVLPLLQDIILFEALEAGATGRISRPLDAEIARTRRGAVRARGNWTRRSSSSSPEFFKSANIPSFLGSRRPALLGPATTSAKSVCSLARPMRPQPPLAPTASSMDSTAHVIKPLLASKFRLVCRI